MRLWLERVPSPIGTLLIATDGEALRALDFHDYVPRLRRLLRTHYGEVDLVGTPRAGAIAGKLQAYFDGAPDALDDVEVRTNGTAFQREVWAALRTIPYGATLSYGRLAARIGKPGSARAVGLANGQNPVAIIVPCHRVIGADGSLTGFGGGLPRKQWLLDHEARHAPNAASESPAPDLFAYANLSAR